MKKEKSKKDVVLADKGIFASFLSGGIAGILSKTVIAPLDRVKIIYQVSHKKFSYWDVWLSMKTIVKEESALGLWRGNIATTLRIFPAIGIQFATYDFLRRVKPKNYFSEILWEEPDGKLC